MVCKLNPATIDKSINLDSAKKYLKGIYNYDNKVKMIIKKTYNNNSCSEDDLSYKMNLRIKLFLINLII